MSRALEHIHFFLSFVFFFCLRFKSSTIQFYALFGIKSMLSSGKANADLSLFTLMAEKRLCISKGHFCPSDEEQSGGSIYTLGRAIDCRTRRLTIMATRRHIARDAASNTLLTYLQRHNYGHCALFIHRLNPSTFRQILQTDLPMDLLFAQLPFSIELIQVIYSKSFIFDPEKFPLKFLKPERFLSAMISLFASSIHPSKTDIGIDQEELKKNLSMILRIISYVQPVLFKRLLRQREVIDQCILYFERTRSNESSIKNVEDHLRQELELSITACQQALHRFESPRLKRRFSAASNNSFEEIQTRLYEHQSMLNLVEPSLSKTKLFALLDDLNEKVTMDKQILLAYSHIKTHEKQLPANEPLLPLFKRFALAYERRRASISSD